MFRILLLALAVTRLIHAETGVDAVQARAMLDLLKQCSDEGIRRVMELPGTRLIIAQQNVSRRR